MPAYRKSRAAPMVLAAGPLLIAAAAIASAPLAAQSENPWKVGRAKARWKHNGRTDTVTGADE